jgi:hypothetical protein
MSRLMRDWRALEPEQRVAGAAALALFVTMLLPWYEQNIAVRPTPLQSQLQTRSLNAFQVFSFIEAAVLLVAVAVVYLLYARAEGRAFHLPGSDGTIVFLAGAWAAALLVLRLFDKPGFHGTEGNVGVKWGIFFALGAAGALAYAGRRMRHAHAPVHVALHRHRRGHADDEANTGEGPIAGEGGASPSPAPSPATAPPATATGAERGNAPVPARSPGAPARTRYPPAPSDQMSFEDPPPSD